MRAVDLDRYRAQSGAGKRIARRPQRVFRVIDAQQDELRGIDAQFEQSAAVDLSVFERGEFLPYPENRAACAKPLSQCNRKAGRCRAVACFRRIDFVQRLAPQTQPIRRAMTQSHARASRLERPV